MTQPTYPLITVYSHKVVTVVSTEAALCKPLPFGAVRASDQEVVFDAKGDKWTYRLTSNQSTYAEVNFGKKLLLYALPSPVLISKPEWRKQGSYRFGELKEIMARCVGKTNDGLTKSTAADRIAAISQANSFEELYTCLMKYGFDIENSKLWREQTH